MWRGKEAVCRVPTISLGTLCLYHIWKQQSDPSVPLWRTNFPKSIAGVPDQDVQPSYVEVPDFLARKLQRIVSDFLKDNNHHICWISCLMCMKPMSLAQKVNFSTTEPCLAASQKNTISIYGEYRAWCAWNPYPWHKRSTFQQQSHVWLFLYHFFTKKQSCIHNTC